LIISDKQVTTKFSGRKIPRRLFYLNNKMGSSVFMVVYLALVLKTHNAEACPHFLTLAAKASLEIQ